MIDFITTSVMPLLIILVLGLFSLYILKTFVSKMPTARHQEPKRIAQEEYIEPRNDESDQEEDLPKIEVNRKEIKSQKEQSINELNDAVMASPEEAAKLLTSFIRD